MPKAKILIVDDDPDVREQISRWLSKDYYFLEEASTGEEALEKVSQSNFDVVLLDIKLPTMNGFKVLKEMHQNYPDVCVIILSAYGDAETIKRALREGAFDFFDKMRNYNILMTKIEKSIERFNASREQDYHTEEEQNRYALEKIIGKSPKALEMMSLVKKVAETDASVLILGESGTGKELVAKAIHYISKRLNKPLVIADCSTITPSLIESELFGHEKGAFTGAIKRKKGKLERANGGSLFIDEIGELNKPLQMKLLRFLQEGTIERVGGEEVIPIDARILAATAVDLKQAIDQKNFREDLYFRFNEFTINIPPLRDRKEDIPLLIDHFIKVYKRKYLKNVDSISSQALKMLLNHDFRGNNVRELEHIISRAIVLTDGTEIKLDAIKIEDSRSIIAIDESDYELQLRKYVANQEKRYLLYQLNKHNWHIINTAKSIGIDRSNLTLKMKKYGIKNHH